MKLPKEGCSCSSRSTRSARARTLWLCSLLCDAITHRGKLIAFLGLIVMAFSMLPAGRAMTCNPQDIYEQYSEAELVVHITALPGRRPHTSPVPDQEVYVVKSWKKKLTGPIRIDSFRLNNTDDEFILFLSRGKDGNFSYEGGCTVVSKYYSEKFQELTRWLDQITECGCKVFDPQQLRDMSDIVLVSDIIAVAEGETKIFADVVGIPFWCSSGECIDGNHPVFFTGTVAFGGHQEKCGFPVKKGDTIPYLYLYRNSKGILTSGACSGNVRAVLFYGKRRDFQQKKQQGPENGHAFNVCTCGHSDEKAYYDRADLVVYGSADKIIRNGAQRKVQFNGSQYWKSSMPENGVTIFADVNEGCRYYPIVEGKDYILYLRRGKDGLFLTDNCSGNVSEDNRYRLQQRLEWFDKLVP